MYPFRAWCLPVVVSLADLVCFVCSAVASLIAAAQSETAEPETLRVCLRLLRNLSFSPALRSQIVSLGACPLLTRSCATSSGVGEVRYLLFFTP